MEKLGVGTFKWEQAPSRPGVGQDTRYWGTYWMRCGIVLHFQIGLQRLGEFYRSSKAATGVNRERVTFKPFSLKDNGKLISKKQINYFNAVLKGDSQQTEVQTFLLDIKIQYCATNVIKNCSRSKYIVLQFCVGAGEINSFVMSWLKIESVNSS